MDYEVEIIRSNRKSLSLEIRLDGRIVARAPMKMSEKEIYDFVEAKRDWINRSLEKLESIENNVGGDKLTQAEINELAQRALEYIPKRVEHYAKIIGVSYGRITIRNQKTKWGSCSSKGNLNFNCLLMLTPPEVIDSVVVHELCHIKEMNHSDKFYQEVYKAFPEYKKWNKWLKQNSIAIMSKMQ